MHFSAGELYLLKNSPWLDHIERIGLRQYNTTHSTMFILEKNTNNLLIFESS